MKKMILLLFMYISIIGYSSEYKGEWEKASYDVRGSWSIVSKEDGIYVILDEKFKTKRGPDLFILLSPLEYSEVNNENADQGAYKVVQLESFKGAAEFKIKDKDLDLSEYKSILIHCIKYSHLWAGSGIDKE